VLLSKTAKGGAAKPRPSAHPLGFFGVVQQLRRAGRRAFGLFPGILIPGNETLALFPEMKS